MSLRFQLIFSVAVALLVSLILGGALVWWQAAASVETELEAALAVSQRTVRNTDDRIFRRGGSQLLLAPEATGEGYAASFAIGLQLA